MPFENVFMNSTISSRLEMAILLMFIDIRARTQSKNLRTWKGVKSCNKVFFFWISKNPIVVWFHILLVRHKLFSAKQYRNWYYKCIPGLTILDASSAQVHAKIPLKLQMPLQLLASNANKYKMNSGIIYLPFRKIMQCFK